MALGKGIAGLKVVAFNGNCWEAFQKFLLTILMRLLFSVKTLNEPVTRSSKPIFGPGKRDGTLSGPLAKAVRNTRVRRELACLLAAFREAGHSLRVTCLQEIINHVCVLF